MMDCSLTSRNAANKNYTERDRLTLSDHSSVDYTNRRHVTLLLNSPSSDILNSIANSGTSNSLKYYHQQQATSACSANSLGDEGSATPTTNGTNPNLNQNQKWKSVRAVMAYYCSLRRIKRNGPFKLPYIFCTRIYLPKYSYLSKKKTKQNINRIYQ